MAYRRTERVLERLATRREEILLAARALAAEQDLDAVQIAPVAERAGIAAGTVYRYFPAKSDLVAALIAAIAAEEMAATRAAADAAPGPLSALAAAVVTFSARAQRRPGLVGAALAAPADGAVEGHRGFRKTLAAELETRIGAAVAARHLPAQDARLAAAAILGALSACAIEPPASDPAAPAQSPNDRSRAQAAALIALRALGIADARARGLVVQTPWPADTST